MINTSARDDVVINLKNIEACALLQNEGVKRRGEDHDKTLPVIWGVKALHPMLCREGFHLKDDQGRDAL